MTTISGHGPNITPAFALTTHELNEIMDFAYRQGLDEIVRLCRELKTIRDLYVQQCHKIAKMEQMLARVSTPHDRFVTDMTLTTNGTGNHA